MSASQSIDGSTFLSHLRASGLASEATIAALRPHAANPDGRAVARALVADGTLTRFQAERLLVGRTGGFLIGQYKILDLIGRGGMGRVYKAEHRTMGRIVALKVLAPELLKTERAVQLFLHEVRAAAQLSHPNIVAAYDANEAGGHYYLVLEYVDGPNLDQLVKKQGPLSVGLACDYIRQVCAGLQCAHAQGMIHRDIKPANILVQPQGPPGGDDPGLVKILDFGLARLGAPSPGLDRGPPGTILTRDNAVMGTPDYLSPEQSRSLHKTDIRSDLYSLGCTFHFLLTGQVPFPGGSALDKMIRHSTEAPTPVTDFRKDVPPAVQAILARLLEKLPENRFSTPTEVAEALRPYAVGGPIPWAGPSRSGHELPVFVDTAPPPPDSSDADLSALARTLPPTLDETPSPESPSRQYRRPPPLPDHSLRLAIIVAVSIIAGLLALIGLAALL